MFYVLRNYLTRACNDLARSTLEMQECRRARRRLQCRLVHALAEVGNIKEGLEKLGSWDLARLRQGGEILL